MNYGADYAARRWRNSAGGQSSYAVRPSKKRKSEEQSDDYKRRDPGATGTRAAMGYFGGTQTVAKAYYGKRKYELKRIDVKVGEPLTGDIPFKKWDLSARLWEYQPGAFVNGTTTSPSFAYTYAASAPVQGSGAGQRVGDRIHIKQNELRICVSKGSNQAAAYCCRLVVIQVMEDSQGTAGNDFVLEDFFQSNNITSFRKKNPDYEYKMLADKMFTVGIEDDMKTDQRMTLNFPTGNAKFDDQNASNSLMVGKGDRIIWGLFVEEIASTDVTHVPSFYGDFKFTYIDP